MGLKSLLQENKAFFTLHALLLVLGAYPLIMYDQVTFFLQLNRLHHPFLDHFFYYSTFWGSSAMYALLILILVVIQLDHKTLLTGICSFVAMSAIVQGMKHIIFPNQLRPIALIPAGVSLHLVEGIVPDIYLSFPSGHAATIFTAGYFIHFLMPKKPVWFSILLFLGLAVAAYARIYLCQHFYKDIYVGAWVGTWVTTLVYAGLMPWKGPSWLEKSPLASLALWLRAKR
ncbi:MAG: phosphatase PAP2 family protein [Bacteroidota bacterium]